MVYSELTKKAMNIAYDAHHGQYDKGGGPYIFHPIHLAEQMKTEEECIVALLHDVLEDSDFTQKDMLEFGIPFEIVSRCEIITRGKDESYMNFVRRCGDEKIVRCVKMADLLHNMDLTRLNEITDKDLQRIKKYHKAYKYLETL